MKKKCYLCNNSLRISEEAPIISFTLATLVFRHWSHTRFDNFKVSTRDALSVLQRTSCNLGSLDNSIHHHQLPHWIQKSLRLMDSLLHFQFFFLWSAYWSHSVHSATNKDDRNTFWGSILQNSIDGIWI